MRHLSWLMMVLMSIALGACERAASSPEASRLDDVVRTTSAPVDALTRRIVGDAVPVELVGPPNADPSAWRPTPEMVARVQRSRLIVSNGAGYEAWVQTAPLPRSRLIEAADGMTEELITVQGETHSHGPEGHHSHEVTLGQVWLDPVHAIEQARAIGNGLSAAFPEHAAVFSTNLGSLIDELTGLHHRLERLDPGGVSIAAPSTPFGYLARRYGWETLDLSQDPSAWSMDLYALRMESGENVSPVRIVICETLPDDSIMDGLRESHNVHLSVWRMGVHGGEVSFLEMFAENFAQLEALIAGLRAEMGG